MMKKIIVTVICGVMLVSLVSCSGSGEGSKEYRETKAILDKYEKAIDKATTCEELKAAYNGYYNGIEEFRKMPKYSGRDQLTFDEKDMMTEEESDNFTNLWTQVDKKHSEKKKELCQ